MTSIYQSEINSLNMQIEEMNSLIGQLFGCNNPNYTPEGKPTFVILEPNTIENYFNN